MAENKTQPTKESVAAFLNGIADDTRRKDCRTVRKIMEEESGAKAVMWGPGIVGFGRYHYKYDSGREGDFLITGFSPRKTDLTLYLSAGLHQFPELMAKLGKCRIGKSCLYIRKLEDVDLGVLRTLVREAVKKMADQRVDK